MNLLDSEQLALLEYLLVGEREVIDRKEKKRGVRKGVFKYLGLELRERTVNGEGGGREGKKRAEKAMPGQKDCNSHIQTHRCLGR